MQKKKITVILFVSLCIVILTCIVFDVFNLFQFDFDTSAATIFALTLLSVIFTLWFSYLLVIKQIYANRYSKEILNEYVYNGNKILIVYFFLSLILGLGLLFAHEYICYIAIGYMLNCVYYIYLCGVYISKKIGENEIRNIVKNNVNNVIKSLDDKNKNKEIKNNLKKIVKLYDDAYNNLDQTTCNMILASCNEFCKSHIKNRNKNIIDSKEQSDELIESFIACYYYFLKKDTSDFARKLNLNIIFSIANLSKICMDCEIKSLFVEFIQTFEKILTSDKVFLESLFEEVYKNLYILEVEAAEQKRKEFFKELLKQSKAIYVVVKFEYNKIDLITYLKHYVSALSKCIKIEDKEYAKLIFSDLKDVIKNEINLENCNTVFIVLSMLVKDENFIKDSEFKDEYLSIMKNLIKNKSIYCEGLYSYTMYAVETFKDIKEYDIANDLQLYLAINSLKNTDDVPAYISPDFFEKLKQDISNQNENERLYSQIKYLINISIEKNNVKWLNILLSEIKEILKAMPKNCKEIQRMWLNIFNNTIIASLSADNNNLKDVTFRYYKETLEEMDNENNISKDLANCLVGDLENLCKIRFRENLDFSCEIVEFLNDLLGSDPVYRFVSNTDVRKNIYQSLYNIGVDAIERNQDLVIQRVSNVLGWKIKRAIESGHGESANILIDYSLSLFNLAKANNICEQTVVFVGTLFIIIGAYCQTNRNYFIYRNKIIKYLKQDPKNIEYLNVSRLLRSSETNGWKDTLGDNPKQRIDEFWRMLIER